MMSRRYLASVSIFIFCCFPSFLNAETKLFANDNLKLSGSFLQGSLLQGQLTGDLLKGYDVLLNNKNVRTTSGGHFVLGFGRDADTTQHLLLKNGVRQINIPFTIGKRTYKTQSITGVPQKTVTPSADKLERIRKETALVKEARKTDSDFTFFLSEFKPPIATQITGVYGSQRIYNGTPKRPHFGIDYAGKMGQLVYAPADAKVTLVHDDMYYSGGTLIVDHGFGVSSTFIHLSEILVNVGQEIKQGDAIAKVGSGGRSTGPHLDWRVNWYQERVDPLLVLKKGN